MNRKAFTVIELTIAIGIIVVLIGIAIAGLRYANSQSRANSTRIAMENLKSMLAEMELATKFATPPAVWYRYVPATGLWHTCLPTDFAGNVDFYRTIDLVNPALLRNTANPAKYTYAPALVTEDARNDWTQMEFTSVANTAILMNALRTLPVNRAAMDRMPAQALQSLTLPPPKGGEPAPPSGTIQIVVDAWKNPIIFVPGTAEIGSVAVPGTYDGPKGLLIGRIYNNTAQYRDGQYVISNDVSYRCIQATVGNAPPNATYWQPMPAIAAPNNRPFFASAGPDGDFSKGDDNIYSFEQ